MGRNMQIYRFLLILEKQIHMQIGRSCQPIPPRLRGRTPTLNFLRRHAQRYEMRSTWSENQWNVSVTSVKSVPCPQRPYQPRRPRHGVHIR